METTTGIRTEFPCGTWISAIMQYPVRPIGRARYRTGPRTCRSAPHGRRSAAPGTAPAATPGETAVTPPAPSRGPHRAPDHIVRGRPSPLKTAPAALWLLRLPTARPGIHPRRPLHRRRTPDAPRRRTPRATPRATPPPPPPAPGRPAGRGGGRTRAGADAGGAGRGAGPDAGAGRGRAAGRPRARTRRSACSSGPGPRRCEGVRAAPLSARRPEPAPRPRRRRRLRRRRRSGPPRGDRC